MEVVACKAKLRRSRYGVVTRFVTSIQYAEIRMNTGFGERGRNRTFNLLIKSQNVGFLGNLKNGSRVFRIWN